MNDGTEPGAMPEVEIMPPSHDRILWLMAAIGVAGTAAGVAFISARFGIGVLLGTVLAFISYYWLKHSLKRVFAEAESGEKPRLSALRYIARYFTLGAIIAFIYATGIVPIAAVIIGLAGFGLATVVEGFIRIFSSIFSVKGI
ncbi:MAG: ATP synthase subunit I [Blastocatellia bacterium]|nr:ATP synthase subunit I [Blastocatellia bacterium]